MNLFNLIAKLFLDTEDYEKGLNKSEKSASSFAGKAKTVFKGAATAIAAVTGAVVACAGALVKLTNAAIDQAGAIDDASKQLQITTTQYQEWDWIMRQIGADSATLSMSFRQLAMFTGNLTEGNEQAMAAMQKLGLSVNDFMNLDAEAQLTTMIEAFQGMEQGIEKTTIAQQVFGARAYQMLLPLLNDSVGAIDNLKTEIHDLGLIMSEEAVSAGEKLGDKLEYMKGAVKQLAYNFGTELFPEFDKIVNGITALATGSDNANEALDNLVDGIMGIVDKIIDKLPQLIDIAANILLKIIIGIVAKLPDMVPALIQVVEQLLFTIIDILPDLVGSVGEIITALIAGLLQLDWVNLITSLFFALMEIIVVQLPDLVYGLIDKLYDLFTGQKAVETLGKIGIKFAEAVVNGIIMGIEAGINQFIRTINLLTKGLSAIWTWTGIPEIPEIPQVSIPRISFMKDGGMFEDLMKGYGTAYAVVGEGNAEIVAKGSKGTGVTNVEQFSEAMYKAFQRYFGNGVVIRIGDREFKGYILQTVNSGLKQQGRQTLNQVTRY